MKYFLLLFSLFFISTSVYSNSEMELQSQFLAQFQASRIELSDNYLELSNGNIMHYYDVGPKDAKPILLVHGVPMSAFLYRKVIHELCGGANSQYRCIALTHIGFGKSSCPEHGTMITPSYQVDQIDEFIRTLELKNFAAVVHDWGGPIGTAAVMRHSEQLSHLLVLNTLLTMPDQGVLHTLMEYTENYISESNPFFFEKVYPSTVRWAVQALTTTAMTEEDISEYVKPLQEGDIGKCRSRATLSYFSKASKEQALFDEIKLSLETKWKNRNAVLIWGVEDPLLGLHTKAGKEFFEKTSALLPQAQLKKIEGANHFLQEDKPQELAVLIKGFIE